MACTPRNGRASLIWMSLSAKARFLRALARITAALLLSGALAPAQHPPAAASVDSPKEQAMLFARKAARAEKAGRFADAYVFWSEAAALQPRNRNYQARMGATQSRAAQTARATPAPAPPGTDASPAPADPPPGEAFDSLTAREFDLARQMQEPPVLRGKPGKFDFDLNLPPRELFTKVAERFGIEPVFDGDYPATAAPLRFRVDGVDFREALRDLEAATDSFVVPLSPGVFMVARDTVQKRNDLEQFLVVSVPVPDALTAQELTEIAQAVRTTTGVEKLALDNPRNAIVMRDRVSRILPAEALLQQLFSSRPQLMIEVELLEATDSDVVSYGFTPTTQIPAVFLGSVLRNATSVPSGVSNLLTFGGGKTLIGLGVATAQASFNQTLSRENTLYHAEIRSVSGQPATLHVGDKYPIQTSGYFGGTTTTSRGAVAQPPPAYTFEDLGLQIKVTPHIHMENEVTLTLETSFELLTGTSSNGIPILGRRQFNSEVRLRDGEWAVVAGIVSGSDSKSVSGFAGLASLPFLGNFFRQTSKDVEHDNIVIAIRPRFLTLGAEMNVPRPVRVGTETRPSTPLL